VDIQISSKHVLDVLYTNDKNNCTMPQSFTRKQLSIYTQIFNISLENSTSTAFRTNSSSLHELRLQSRMRHSEYTT